MLAPRKFMQKRKKVEVFKDDADEADQKNRRKMMNEDDVGTRLYDCIFGSSTTLMGFLVLQADKYEEAEEVFETILTDEASSLRPDQQMFHMMIYMYKKARKSDKARKLFSMMNERGLQQTSVTYNSLMSFETNYKEVAKIYDQMQSAKVKPDVVSYALLISAYGKARREEEALAVLEEMLDAGVRCVSSFVFIGKLWHRWQDLFGGGDKVVWFDL